MATTRGNAMQRKLAVCLIIALLSCASATIIGGPAHAEPWVYEGPGWPTPEETVTAYLEGLKAQNLSQMIGAYAVETCIDKYDLQANLARIGAYTASMVSRLPNTNALTRGINIEARKNEIVQAALWQITTVCMPEQDFSQPISFGSENREKAAADFTAELDAAYASVDFSTLTVGHFIPPELISEHYASEQNQKNLAAQAAPYGVDEIRSLVAFFTVDNKIGALCCDVVRYGDLWYLFRSNGNIGALLGLAVYTGGMIAVDAQEVMQLRDQMSAEEQALLDALLGGLGGAE